MTSSSASTVLTGLIFGLSLIIAIGAQNVFVLREGLRRTHVFLVVTICAVSDLVLIMAGTAGLGTLIEQRQWLVTGARIAGAAFLVTYGLLAARRAVRPRAGALAAAPVGVAPETNPSASSRLAVASTALALTWLNPHVYLDTVLLLGSIAASHGDQRWWFGLGAMIASILWFTVLGYGARLLGPLLARPHAWRWLDAIIALIMLVIAVNLLLGI